MYWTSLNKDQKEFVKEIMSVRVINSLLLDENIFVNGKYSPSSEREDAVRIEPELYKKILLVLQKSKLKVQKSEDFKLIDVYNEIESVLYKLEMIANVKFKTLQTLDKNLKELKSLEDVSFSEEMPTAPASPLAITAAKKKAISRILQLKLLGLN